MRPGLIVTCNSSMAPLYAQAVAAPASLPADLEAVRAQGVTAVSNRIVLQAYATTRLPVPPALEDNWSAERWVNDIALDSDLDPSDSAWRPQLIAWGLTVIDELLPQAAGLFQDGRSVQADLSLQSAPGLADPDLDFASGAVHIYSVRTRADDQAPRLEEFDQPCLVVTNVAVVTPRSAPR